MQFQNVSYWLIDDEFRFLGQIFTPCTTTSKNLSASRIGSVKVNHQVGLVPHRVANPVKAKVGGTKQATSDSDDEEDLLGYVSTFCLPD